MIFDIASAPKDGSEIQLWSYYRTRYSLMHNRPGSWKHHAVARWSTYIGKWLVYDPREQDWFSFDEMDNKYDLIKITHWAPKPRNPKTEPKWGYYETEQAGA